MLKTNEISENPTRASQEQATSLQQSSEDYSVFPAYMHVKNS